MAKGLECENLKIMHVFQMFIMFFLRVHVACLLLVVALLSSCSHIKLGYSFADTYLKYQVSSLFDLDNAQKQFVYGKVNTLDAWHKKEELEPLIDLAKQFKHVSADATIDPNEFSRLFQTIDAGRTRYLKKAIPAIVELLAMLNDEQVEAYKATREEDAEHFEELEDTEEKRIEQRLEKSIDYYEDWLQQLTEQQKSFIRSTIDSSHERIARQKKDVNVHTSFFILLCNNTEQTATI